MTEKNEKRHTQTSDNINMAIMFMKRCSYSQ